jgi:hypothetical protein
MARPSNWNTPTTAIRVPTQSVEQLAEIARMLRQLLDLTSLTHQQHMQLLIQIVAAVFKEGDRS